MNEYPILIANLNDFIFCPVSIYYHNLDYETDKMQYQDEYQINGTAAHSKSDSAAYSTRVDMLQGVAVYCEEYNLFGKIDTFDVSTGVLTERKKKIKKIYDGYIFQLYAQYFALTEMGYKVNQLRLYSMDDNTVYRIKLPSEDKDMLGKFQSLIQDIKMFSMNNFIQKNYKKCQKCIYEPLCSYAK